jgi:hypothetical protein
LERVLARPDWVAVGSLLGVCVVSTLLFGCGAHAPRRGLSDNRTSIFPARPDGTLTPSDMAFGGGPWIRSPSNTPYGLSDAELAAYLKPEARALAARTPAPEPTPAPRAPARAPALPPPPPVVATTPEPAPQSEQLAALSEPKPAERDITRYAERQQRSRDLLGYRGGDAVVITTSTLIIILLVVLLIVLLT